MASTSSTGDRVGDAAPSPASDRSSSTAPDGRRARLPRGRRSPSARGRRRRAGRPCRAGLREAAAAARRGRAGRSRDRARRRRVDRDRDLRRRHRRADEPGPTTRGRVRGSRTSRPTQPSCQPGATPPLALEHASRHRATAAALAATAVPEPRARSPRRFGAGRTLGRGRRRRRACSRRAPPTARSPRPTKISSPTDGSATTTGNVWPACSSAADARTFTAAAVKPRRPIELPGGVEVTAGGVRARTRGAATVASTSRGG